MARPRKTGLDYFPFDVDFFEDDKLTAISVQFGIKGEIAAVKLLCAIYRNGYFIEWKESVCIKLLRELPGISESLLEQIVRGLVKWGFFDKALFDTARILTSHGIQRRYFSISRRNRRSGQGGELPYLLSDNGMNETSMEKEDIPKEGVLEFSATETEFSATETELSRAKSTQIKEKEIKEEENKFSLSMGGKPPEEKEREINFDNFIKNFKYYANYYNSSISPPVRMTDSRKSLLHRLLDNGYTKDDMVHVIVKACSSPVLNGRGKKSFIPDFDWIFDEKNFVRILEGVFNDKQQTQY